jgi:hypothetical protein
LKPPTPVGPALPSTVIQLRERRVLAHEAAARRLGRIPDVLPSTFNEQSHVSLLSVSL